MSTVGIHGGSVSISGTVTVDSELPAAAALSDNMANPTAPAVGAFGMVWDGATWDRQPGTAADGTLVNLGANNDITVTPSAATAAGAKLLIATVQATASGNTTLISAPGGGSHLELYRVQYSNSSTTAAITVGVRFGAAGTIFGKTYMPASGGQGMINLSGYQVPGADNEALNINLSGAGQIEATAFYRTVTP